MKSKINKADWVIRAEATLAHIEGKNVIPSLWVNELFNLHNDRIQPEEFGKHCGSCVQRVINRIKAHLLEISNETIDKPIED